MKLVLTLMLLVATPAALANSVTVKNEDKVLISSNSLYIVSKNSDRVKLNLDCDLNIQPESEVVVKSSGRKITKSKKLKIEVDNEKKTCKVLRIV